MDGLGPCAGCGHEPACGFASTWSEQDGERWWCHADDHSCYVPAPVDGEVIPLRGTR